MSEYWKSTPKYWCKHCKTYVRDTKLEKTNHEATPKHQGNLKRFLRDLHRGHEKAEKDKERAKAEVARLNGMGSSSGGGNSSMASSSGVGRGPTPTIPKPQATASQRKQQLAQLAEMGVAIPDEFRPDMAMAGEWQVTAEHIVDPNAEKKPEALALGVRKREPGDEDEDEAEVKKRRWGSAYRAHLIAEDSGDLDALLSNLTRKAEPVVKPEVNEEPKTEVKSETEAGVKLDSEVETRAEAEDGLSEQKGENDIKTPNIKHEQLEGAEPIPSEVPPLESATQEGGSAVGSGVVFKKRKAKNIRQK